VVEENVQELVIIVKTIVIATYLDYLVGLEEEVEGVEVLVVIVQELVIIVKMIVIAIYLEHLVDLEKVEVADHHLHLLLQ
jgi:hypothetical protein